VPLHIVLIGSECTGKTTLAAKLAEHFKVEFVPEYLRSYFEQKNGNLTVDDAIPIAEGQIQLETEAENKSYNPIICDTDIISSIVYTKHYFKKLPVWFEKQIQERADRTYLLCDIDVTWVGDGQRDMPEGREYMQNLFISELEDRNLNYHFITGPVEKRLHDAIALINIALHDD